MRFVSDITWKVILLSVLLATMVSGCATHTVKRKVIQATLPGHEFIPAGEYKGRYVGLVEKGGQEYDQFQFDMNV